MFNNRFLLVLSLLSLLLVAMAVSRTPEKSSTSDDLSWSPRPVIIPVTGGDNLAIQRGREADAARLKAMAKYYQSIEEVHFAERGREADSVRLTALAEYYQKIEGAYSIQRGRAADALRWTAIAKHYR